MNVKLLVNNSVTTFTHTIFINNVKLALYLKYIEEHKKYLHLNVEFTPLSSEDMSKKHYILTTFTITHKEKKYLEELSESSVIDTTEVFSFNAVCSEDTFNPLKSVIQLPDEYLKDGNLFNCFLTDQDTVADDIAKYIYSLQKEYEGVLNRIDENASIYYNTIVSESNDKSSDNVNNRTLFVFINDDGMKKMIKGS